MQRRTILQPIRTEIFRIQLEELRAVLRLFTGGEGDFRGRYAFGKLEAANIALMFDSYARTVFGLECKREERPYNRNECPVSIVHEDLFTLADGYIAPENEEEPPDKTDPRVRAVQWNDYKHGEMPIPREYYKSEEELQRIIESPLLPKECVGLIEDFQRIVSDNTSLLQRVLVECAAEMPVKYPTQEMLQRASANWIHARYNHEFQHLKPKADEIVKFIRGYWAIDQLPED